MRGEVRQTELTKSTMRSIYPSEEMLTISISVGEQKRDGLTNSVSATVEPERLAEGGLYD